MRRRALLRQRIRRMKVHVKFFAELRERTGEREKVVELAETSTLKDLLNELERIYGKKFAEYVYEEGKKLSPSIQFLINGVHIGTLNGIDTRLSEGDEVSIIPPVGGG